MDRKDLFYIVVLIVNMFIGGYLESMLYKLFREIYYLVYDVDFKFEYDKLYFIIYVGVNIESKDLVYNIIVEMINNFMFDGLVSD